MQKIIATLIILITLISFPITASAQSNLEDQKEQIQNNREDLQETIDSTRTQIQQSRELAVEQRCELITTRVDNIIERYNTNTLRYVNRYNNLNTKLNNLYDALTEREIDTLNLKSQIENQETQTAEFNNQMQEVINELELSKGYVCGESEGQYRNSISESRQALLEARLTAIEINQYFLNTIVPELNQIKTNYKSNI